MGWQNGRSFEKCIKPIAIGNILHFGVGAIALFKIVSNVQTHSEVIISLAVVVYVIFAVLFAYVFLANPTKTTN